MTVSYGYSSEFHVKCPFTEEGVKRFSELCRKYGLGLEDLTSSDIGRKALEHAVNIVLKVLENGHMDDLQEEDPDLEVLANYIAIFIVAALDKRVWRRFADAISKKCCDLLKSRSGGVSPDVIIKVAFNLGIDVKPVREVTDDFLLTYTFDVVVPLWQYLRLMPKFDPNWKLYSKYVLGGFVFLTYRDLMRLIEEAIERRVMDLIERASTTSEVMRQILESIGVLSRLNEKALDTRPVKGVRIQGQDVIPPCMQAIIDEIRSGGNPSHQARFAVAAYLLRKCHEYEGKQIEECVEEVVELFKNVADFDEKKTRYQVEHIAGLRGGRKFYMPPNCDELISLGLCPNNGACGVKNPLVYTAMRLKKSRDKTGANGGKAEGIGGKRI